jgi:deoxyribodipyrimidine photo-lyase
MTDRTDQPFVQPTRIQILNRKNTLSGDYVLYWMQQSQRAEENHALEYAVELANHLKQSLLVVFGIMDDYPEANLRHFTFMLEGLQETQQTLAKRGIQMVVRLGHPAQVALQAGKTASIIVCDRGYLRHQKQWRRKVAANANCRVVQVESDVVAPIEVVSDKAEYAARTIRPRIHRQLPNYLKSIRCLHLNKPSSNLSGKGLNLNNIQEVLEKITIDSSVQPVSVYFKGGTSRAKKTFDRFMRQNLRFYDDHSNQPQTDDISHMSMYLHFGQISPLYLALKIRDMKQTGARNRDAFLEQLIVRRELAMNFAHYTPNYDRYACIPAWARQTLAEHESDSRPHRYTPRQLEKAQTHDPYWNAAMNEMRCTGFMHNYMRMYWGKKILEWRKTPRQAFKTMLALNNKYFIDGRDPNAYTGVAWIFGVHDRPWKERPIFGKIRYMAASGLERKCDIQAYVAKVQKLVKKSSR